MERTIWFFILSVNIEFESSAGQEVLAWRNFQIPCFKILILCWLGVFINRYICIAGRTYGQIFTIRGIFEKAARIGDTAMWSSSNSPSSSPLVIRQIVVFASVLIHRSKYWSLYCFFFFFCCKQSDQAQTRCQVITTQCYLVICVNNLLIMYVVSRHFFKFSLEDKRPSWSKLPDGSRRTVWTIIRSNIFLNNHEKKIMIIDHFFISFFFIAGGLLRGMRTSVHFLHMYNVSFVCPAYLNSKYAYWNFNMQKIRRFSTERLL